jgi:hypothetical protein
MTAISTETRKTGIDVVGDMPWGTHFCLFYETKKDLLEILISYCRCMSSEHFGQLARQFKRVSGSSGLKVQAAIAC